MKDFGGNFHYLYILLFWQLKYKYKMTNLNQKIFMAINTSKKQTNIKDTLFQYWFYSLWATHSYYDINYYSLTKRLQFLNCNKIIIYNINPYIENSSIELVNKDFRNYLPISIDNPYYIKYNTSLKNFFKNENFEELTKKNIKYFENDTILNNSILIFNSLPLPFILASFKCLNIILIGGIKNKRGVLSPVQHRLSQFNTCLEGINNVTITESFHNYDALAIQPIFQQINMEKIEGIKTINNFFVLLEHYYKIKINSINSDQEFNLRKNNKDYNLNYNDFIEFCKSNKKIT
jgi:hypothetical protein